MESPNLKIPNNFPNTRRRLAAAHRRDAMNHVWACYSQDRTNVELRNRLAEYYTPLVQQIAQRYIKHCRLRDADAAMSDALLMLVVRIIPQYDGTRSFRGWVTGCIRDKMLERKRLETRIVDRFEADFGGEDDWPQIEALLVAPKEPGADIRFAEVAAAVSARDAAILWLRFYRHLTDKEIAGALNTDTKVVRRQFRRAIGALRKLAGMEEPHRGRPHKLAAGLPETVGWDQRACERRPAVTKS